MMAHKHAHLMMLYAKDALESDEPWENWEFRDPATTLGKAQYWLELGTHPEWIDTFEYRRKPDQSYIDLKAFKDWYGSIHDVPSRAEVWLAALEWERNRSK